MGVSAPQFQSFTFDLGCHKISRLAWERYLYQLYLIDNMHIGECVLDEIGLSSTD